MHVRIRDYTGCRILIRNSKNPVKLFKNSLSRWLWVFFGGHPKISVTRITIFNVGAWDDIAERSFFKFG